MSEVVSYEVVDGIALITIDNPPVNAMSHAVRQGCWEALDRLAAPGPWLLGAELSLADLHLAPNLDYFRRAPEGERLVAGSRMRFWRRTCRCWLPPTRSVPPRL